MSNRPNYRHLIRLKPHQLRHTTILFPSRFALATGSNCGDIQALLRAICLGRFPSRGHLCQVDAILGGPSHYNLSGSRLTQFGQLGQRVSRRRRGHNVTAAVDTPINDSLRSESGWLSLPSTCRDRWPPLLYSSFEGGKLAASQKQSHPILITRIANFTAVFLPAELIRRSWRCCRG